MQLFGRASRQGQPGSSIAIISLEDNLISHYLASSIKNGLSRYLTYGWIRTGAIQIYRLIQRWSDFRASRQRIRILLEDMRFQKLMSFTKKVH
jgi:preprotein translocase subunit SecA